MCYRQDKMPNKYFHILHPKNEKHARDETLVQSNARDIFWLTSVGKANARTLQCQDMPEGNAFLTVPSQALGWQLQKCSTSCPAASVMLSELHAKSSTITQSVTARSRLQPHRFNFQRVRNEALGASI